MRILFVTDGWYPYMKGGADKYITELAQQMAIRGHKVVVATMRWWCNDGANDDELRKKQLRVFGLCKPFPMYDGVGNRSCIQALRFALGLLSNCILGRLKLRNFDIIHVNVQPYFHVFVLKLLKWIMGGKIILVGTVHEMWRDYWHLYLHSYLKGLIAQLIEEWSIRSLDKVVVPSMVTYQKVQRTRREVHLIPNGFRLSSIGPHQSSNEFDVICVSRLVPHKSIDLLIKAISLAKHKYGTVITCVIIGEGPQKDMLRCICEQETIEDIVVFGGSVSEEELYRMIRSSKLMVHPSLREGFGLSVLEAMACGVPVMVIESPDNAATTLVRESNAGIIVKSDPDQIARNMISLIKDDVRRFRFSQNGLKYAQKCDWKAVTELIEKVYSVP